MRFTLRSKLILLVSSAVLTIGLVLAIGTTIAIVHRGNIDNLQSRLVPRIELALRLDAEFSKLGRTFQDAAQAQEVAALQNATATRNRIFAILAEAGPALNPTVAASLRWKVQDYYDTAQQVTRMLIAEETGPEIPDAIAEMQRRQQDAARAIALSTSVDRHELSGAFSSLHRASQRTSYLALGVGLFGLGLVAALGYWISRQMLGGMSTLSAGLSRFALSNFEQRIELPSNDELADLARDANAMAANLQQLQARQIQEDWLKSGHVELAAKLSGNPSIAQSAKKAAEYLAGRTQALAAAVYFLEPDDSLSLVGHCGGSSGHKPGSEVPRGKLSAEEGLLGRALNTDQLSIATDLPENYFQIVSGLGQGAASHLAFLPLSGIGRAIGVIELAFAGDPAPKNREFLRSIQDLLFVNFEAARARAAVSELLEETKKQAELLAQQEEELRLNNQELLAQQEELRKANEELEDQQQVLTERNHELDVARARVQEKVEELSQVSLYKSQFLANMSHELRTPLNSMLLLSYLLAQNEGKNLTDKQVEHCLTIHSAGVDLLDLINQVLDLSKIESGRQDIRIEEVAVTRIVDSLQRVFAPLAEEKNLRFSIEVAQDTPPSLYTDRLRLERILTNLLGNAIKFTEHGSVSLLIAPTLDVVPNDAQAETDMLSFSVRDTGIGIAPGQQARVFVPFEQLEASSSRRFQGTGLGLSIARESVRLLGGEISVQSEVGKGSTFTCTLPVRLETRDGDSGQPPAQPLELSVPPVASLPPNEPVHILVIEDDPVLGEQILGIVTKRGLRCVLSSSGNEGLAIARSRHPKGIILDVKLPDIDGWTVMERLKSDPLTQDIPVHFLSALDAPHNGLERGAVGYLTKPVTLQALSDLVQKMVPASDSQSQKILVVEDNKEEGVSIVALLESQNFEAHHVRSAEEALQAISSDAYGCIILDLGLQGLDGLGFLTELRARSDSPEFSVIVHTGRSLTRAEQAELGAHTQAVVLKDGSSSTRLLEEVRLFAHHVRERLPHHEVPPTQHSFNDEKTLEGRRVLLIEDDMRTVYSLSALLHSRGCEVFVAENGKEALRVLDDTPNVECVITDIMMPVMDGYATMAHLRSLVRFKHLPIIALTARAAETERARCLAAGANEFLVKPVDGRKLIDALQRCVQGAPDA